MQKRAVIMKLFRKTGMKQMAKRFGLVLAPALFALSVYAEQTAVEQAVVSRTDARITLGDASFVKRLATDGLGQVLDVTFEIYNNTDRDIKLNLVMVAFHETTLVDATHRGLVEYPKWRKRDLEAEVKYIVMHDVTPDIERDTFTQTDMHDYASFPSFLDLLLYLDENPGTGVNFILPGTQSGSLERMEASNLVLDMQPMKTSVWAKFRMGFDARNRFFNYYGVVVTDPESGKVITSRLYHFTAPFTVR